MLKSLLRPALHPLAQSRALHGTPPRAGRPTAPGPESYAYFLGFQSRWADNDMYGHFNNVVYVQYVDALVNEYLINHANLTPHKSTSAIGLVVSSNFSYASSLSYPSPILAGLAVTSIGRTSVTYSVALFDATDLTSRQSLGRGQFRHELPAGSEEDWSTKLVVKKDARAAAWGTFVHVFATTDGSQRSTEIPPTVRVALERLLMKE